MVHEVKKVSCPGIQDHIKYLVTLMSVRGNYTYALTKL